MKKSELLFSFLLVPLDFLMITLAAISAYNIRFSNFTTEIIPIVFNLDFNSYLKISLIIAGLWIVIFAFAGLYNIKEGTKKLSEEIYRVILACSTGFMLIAVLIFLRRELFDSRFIVLVAFGLSIIYVILSRSIVRHIQKLLFKYNIGVHKIILVGTGNAAVNLTEDFKNRKQSGYEIVKHFNNFSLETSIDLVEFLKTNEVDEIIQSDSNLSKEEVLRLYDFTSEHHLTFKYAADLLETKVLKTEVQEIAGIPIVEVKKTPLEGWGKIAKRIFDFLFSIFFIIIFSPVMLATAILIKIDSKGPIIYKNKRVGAQGGQFLLLKFRTMKTEFCTGDDTADALAFEEKLLKNKDNDTKGPVYKMINDPRVTKLGKFLRRWSLDELPQFFNALKGNISLIGPRPHQVREVAKYEAHHKKVLTIKPGITGMAQVSGRSDLSFEEEVRLDTYYIENWSMWLDLTILIKTPIAVLKIRKKI